MNISFQGVLDWASGEGKNLILIAGIFFALVLAFKRQFIGAIGTFLVLIVAYAFVSKPTMLAGISEWFTGLLGIG